MKVRWGRRIVWILLILALICLIYFASYIYRISYIACGYEAKILCSAIFVSGRQADKVLQEELSDPRLASFKVNIDSIGKKVTVSGMLGIVKRTAYFREGLGATLDLPENMRLFKIPLDTIENQSEWPEGEFVDLENLPAEIDRKALAEAVDWAFQEPDSQNLRKTRAVVVVYKGKIIAEKYAEGFNEKMPLLGWSMTKSITNALVGIRVKEGKLSVDDKDLLPEWHSPDDPRRKISLKNLLQMSSGLNFKEAYTDLFSDVVVMLYREKDAAGFAINKPLIHSPEEVWHYSSGATNIVCRILRDTFAGDEAAYWNFPRKKLFQKIGMKSAQLETDAAGTFVGSSYLYATPRDWARFGLLYLQNGQWKGEKILPEDWVKFSTEPAPAAPKAKYGAFWWLGPQSVPCINDSLRKFLPDDMFSAEGHEGQYLTIIPSKNLIVLRMGLTKKPQGWDHGGFIFRILAAIAAEK